MAITVTYPINADLQAVAQDKLPNLIANRPIFNILPIRNVDADVVMWDQEDNYTGLQAVRGLNGQPQRVKRIGGKRYLMQPGVYGEFAVIDEVEITRRRPYGAWSGSVPIDDLVMKAQDQLLGRRLDRIEKIGWDLLTTGTFSVAGPDGITYQTDTFTLQTASAAVDWDTAATATPLIDFRAVQLLSRGHSVNFGARAHAYMNRVTFNKMIKVTNSADLGGKRTTGLAPINDINGINTILGGEDLPQITIFDGGYQNDSNTFVPFIADDKVVIVGVRTDGAAIGEYQMTRNANNPGAAPGAYMKVVDDPDEVPRLIEVHDGHNGGPAIFFPSAIVILSV